MARRKKRQAARGWSDFDHRPARETTGGIKAQTKRGAFGKSWWAKAWIAVLEGFDVGGRLARGRTYARKGQVTGVQIEAGLVKAQVQGSLPRPYKVTIKVEILSDAAWRKVGEALSSRASFAARLLAGDMPQDIGDVFTDAGFSLFPRTSKDLVTDCSCPDWSNPCKHVAAVYYLLGETFDNDPFLIFKMRGMDRQELMGLVGEFATAETVTAPLPAEPLPLSSALFWGVGSDEAWSALPVEAPLIHALLPKRVGAFPLWRGNSHFLETLERLYAQATHRGQAAAMGEVSDEESKG